MVSSTLIVLEKHVESAFVVAQSVPLNVQGVVKAFSVWRVRVVQDARHATLQHALLAAWLASDVSARCVTNARSPALTDQEAVVVKFATTLCALSVVTCVKYAIGYFVSRVVLHSAVIVMIAYVLNAK